MKSKPNTNSVTAALVMTVTLVKATICSREGQETVVKDGYLPISGKIAGEELAKLD